MTFSWDILFHPLHPSSPLYWNKPLIQRGKKKRIRIDPSTQEKPYLKAFQHFVINPECWRSERQLHRERYPLERWAAPRFPHPPSRGRHPSVPGFHCLFSPSPLSALLFNSRNEFHTHPPRARCPVTLPRRRFMCQCPERSGWRKTRSACPHTCVSVPASWMDRGWMEWADGQTVNQKGQLHGPREAGLQARAGGTLWDSFPTVSRNSWHPSPPAAPSPKMALKTVRFRDSWCSVVSLCVDLNSDYDRGTTGSTESPKKQGELLGESLSS